MRNVADVLADLSKPVLSALLKEVTRFLSTDGHSRSGSDARSAAAVQDGDNAQRLRDQLAEVLLDDTRLHILYDMLSTYEKNVLRYFIFQVEDHCLTYRHLQQETGQLKPNLFRLGLTGLRRKGLLYTLRRQWGEVAYFLPEDLAGKIYRIMLKEKGFAEGDVCTDNVRLAGELKPPVYVDLLLMLDDLRHQPQRKVPLTRKRTIHKRFIRRWEEKLPERRTVLDRCSLPISASSTYSSHLALLLDFLTRHKLIRWHQDHTVLDVHHVRRWMDATREQLSAAFITYWFRCYKPSAVWLARYQKDMLDWYEACRRRGKQDWTYVLSFVERWEEHYDLPSIPDMQEQIERELLDPLSALGLLAYGETERGEKAWRFQSDNEQEAKMWLQPNLELYAPASIPIDTIWRITELFELPNWEHMLVFRLSEQRTRHFLENGGSLADWLAWLAEHLSTPLADSLTQKLSGLQRAQQKITITDQTLIAFDDPHVAAAFSQWPEVQSLRLEKLNERTFSVPLSQKEALCSVFEGRGLKVSLPQEEEDSQQEENPPVLILHEEDRQAAYKVESVFPELTEAIPAWKEIPEMWTKHFGAYHEKTKRDILNQAIEHGLLLKVEDREGNIICIQPEQSFVENGRWTVQDRQNKKHVLADIVRLQLLFPELD